MPLRYRAAMLALISPAKSLDYERPLPPLDATTPRFAEDAERLAAAAAKLSAKKLGALMHISPKLATLNAERFRAFADAPERPALYAFAGDVYQGFEVATLDEPALAYAQGHLRILSGLYGLLRPLDLIRPYRLEMGTRWAPGRKKDLYAWWGDRIGTAIADDLDATGGDLVINLASQEYWQALGPHVPKGARVLTIDFREDGPNGPRFVSFNAKRARGLMARWICEHRIADPQGLKSFDSDGYRFDPDVSTTDSWRFIRS